MTGRGGPLAERAAELAHARMRDLILSGELQPNHRLVEEELAAQLGVSRTPVREALLRLRQEGLVDQRKGWFVRNHGPAEVLEFLEARAALESVTAGLAATRISDEVLEELDELVEQMSDGEHSRREINALNSRFHARITESSGNTVLTSVTRGTDINYWTFATPIVFTAADDEQVEADHRALLAAIRDHNADEAARVARDHVDRTAAIIARSLGLEQRTRS